MRLRIIGATQVAAELAAAAAQIRDDVRDVANEQTAGIVETWRDAIPESPGGYEGAGFTSSYGANQTAEISDGPIVGAEAVNWSFVASFLQGGTAHHGPKVDLLGAAEPYVEQYVDSVADRAGL